MAVHAQQSSYGDLQKIDETRRLQQEDVRNTIGIINHICYLYEILNTYNNICVLQDEYDKLSSKIDFTKIPDETIKDMVKKALNTLNELKMQEDEYAFYKEMLEDDRMAKRKELFFTLLMALPHAVGEGLGNVKTSSGTAFGAAIGVTAPAIAKMGQTFLKDTFGSVVDYQKRLDELRRRNKEYKFEYDRKKLQKLHDYNIKMLDSVSDLARKFGLHTNDIVNADEVHKLIVCIKGNDRKTIFLNLSSDHYKEHFSTFPMFWYYLASTAVECGEYDEAIKAAERFEKVNSGFIKTDVTCAYVAIAKITAMIAKSNKEKTAISKDEIKRNLKTIQYVNLNDDHPDWSYLCASTYYDILGEPEEAKKVLTTLIANLEGLYKGRLKSYRDLYKKKELAVEENPIPIETNLLSARILYKDILKNEKVPTLEKDLVKMCGKNTVASIEKLYYVGDVREIDLWRIAEKDVMDISLYYQTNTFSKNEIVIDIPVNWFLLGDVEANVTLLRNGKKVAALKELFSERTIRSKKAKNSDQSLVRLRYKCPKSKLLGIDAIVLDFPHESWPVKITYMPGEGYSFPAAEFEDDSTPFVPAKIQFMETFVLDTRKYMKPTVRDLQRPEEIPPLSNSTEVSGVNLDQFKRKEDIKQIESAGIPLWVAHRLFAFKEASKGTHYIASYQNGSTSMINKYGELDDFIPLMSVMDDSDIHVWFSNPTSEKGKMDIGVSFYNEYGAQIFSINDTVDLTPESTDVLKLKWPEELKGIKSPRYVLVQYFVSKGVWEKYKSQRSHKERQKDDKIRNK